MAIAYILGAGFSKTCGIATDVEMLEALNTRLKPTEPKGGGPARTTIQYLLEQNFRDRKEVGFELFMSTLSSLKFLSESWGAVRNVFQEEERELRTCLKDYLKSCVLNVDWENEGDIILEFVRQVDWEKDFVLTFNYDLLLEAAAKRLGVDIASRVIHLHGAVNEKALAWPTYTKFAYRTIKQPLSPRWKKAFDILRNQAHLDKLVFIGYSMPASDLETRGLFNYADMYNCFKGPTFVNHELVPENKRYTYDIVVVNPNPDQIRENYSFFRKKPEFLPIKLEKWVGEYKR